MTSSGFQVDVDVKDVMRLIDTLDRLLDVEIGHWMRDDLQDYLVNRASGRFTSEGDDASGAWAPLKPSTEVTRARHGFSPAHPINVRTHDLQNFILGASGSVVGAGTWQFIWPGDPPSGDLVDKMQTAQTGSVNPSTVPRPVIALGAKDYNEILDSLTVFMMNGLT